MENIVKELCVYILENINNDITMEKIENTFYYNKCYLIRIFKAYTGYTIKEFINTVKVLKTINPLVFTDDTILKIALCNGFNSQEYYSEKFKEVIGIPPLSFRKQFNELDALNDVNKLEALKQYFLYLQEYEQHLLNLPQSLETCSKIKKLTK